MAGKKRYNKYIQNESYSIMEVCYKDIIIDVIIDNDYIDRIISIGKWHAILDQTLKTDSYYIAHRFNSKKDGKGVIKLHRLITNCPESLVVDHINHNTLDNRKQNLRICTRFENQQNLRSKVTEQTGVYYRTKRNIWVANISKNKKRYSKEFKTKEDAVQCVRS